MTYNYLMLLLMLLLQTGTINSFTVHTSVLPSVNV